MGRCWWTDKTFNSTHICSCPTVSLVVRNPKTSSVPRVGSQDRRLPNFFPTWPSFVLASGRGPFSRYINQIGKYRVTQVEGGMGLSPLSQIPALKAHPKQLQTQAHRLWAKQPAAWSMAWGCLGSLDAGIS